jgi:hypothetical protein
MKLEGEEITGASVPRLLGSFGRGPPSSESSHSTKGNQQKKNKAKKRKRKKAPSIAGSLL